MAATFGCRSSRSRLLINLVPGGLKIQWRELGWKALIGEFASATIGAEMVELEELT